MNAIDAAAAGVFVLFALVMLLHRLFWPFVSHTVYGIANLGAVRFSKVIGAVGIALKFYIHCLDGDSASEYQLLRFWDKGDRREFQTVTGGVLHASGGTQDNVVDFKFEKVAGRTYKVVLKNLGAGEYGFLAPGTTAGLNAASQGQIYSFRIAE